MIHIKIYLGILLSINYLLYILIKNKLLDKDNTPLKKKVLKLMIFISLKEDSIWIMILK